MSPLARFPHLRALARVQAAGGRAQARVASAVLLVAGLALLPAPLLPPNGLAEAIRSWLGIGASGAYLVAALSLQVVCYGALGLLAVQLVERGPTVRGRLLQAALLPLVVVGAALLVRTVRLGRLPVLANAAVPIAACVTGGVLGVGILHRSAKTVVAVAAASIVLAGIGWRATRVTHLAGATEAALHRIVDAGPWLAAGDERFEVLLREAFALSPGKSENDDAEELHRAALLALGIAVGHEKVAPLAGLELDPELMRRAVALRSGTTLRGREDWARHFALSAALAIVGGPLVSDAGGLVKEELDALTRGSGFSFGDLAADRAGVRFAVAATGSEEAARALRSRFRRGFAAEDLFPPVADLPEDLTLEGFRERYGGVGSRRYREQLDEIEARLDRCAALARP
jgi:hypothetical protein